jgi:hypothetical protein
MKKILSTILLFTTAILGYSQGINFQGVARSANGTIIAGSNVSLRLSIIAKNVDATPEYVETKTVMTNAQGIFSIVVGDGSNTTVVGNFKNIIWSENPKFLKVEMDPAGGTNYLNMGATQLQYVPYSFYSYGVDASNVKGIVPVKAGGTGVATLEELKTALNIVIPPSIDTNSLSNRINGKLSSIDTASLSNRINSKLSTSDFTSKDLADIRENIVIGPYALINNKTGYGNIALGKNSLNFLDSGSNNIAIGANTLTKMVIGGGGQGSENLAIGSSALQFSTGNGNTAVGTQTLQNSTKAYWNVAVGQHVMRSLLTGSNNVGIGYAAMINSSGSATNNTIIGYNAGQNILSNNNTAIGESSLKQNTTGSQNTSIGNRSLFNNILGNSNIAIGNYTLYNNKNGSNKIAIGNYALMNDTLSENIAIGAFAMNNNTSGNANTAIGSFSLLSNTTGYFNTSLGWSTLTANTTGTENTAIGQHSMAANSTGSNNTALGRVAAHWNMTGSRNTAIGLGSLFSNYYGSSNTAVGIVALQNAKESYNTAVGDFALGLDRKGNYNTAIGFNAGASLDSGENNIFIGSNAGNNNAFSNINNKLIIANSNTITPLIYGDFSNKKLKFNADIDSLSILNRINFVDENANDHINKYDTGYNSPLIYSRYFYGHYGDLIIQGMSKTYTGNIHFVTGSNMPGYESPRQRMVIMDNGNVGVGDFVNSAPTSKLQVSGIVSASGYKIPGGTSAQYLRADGTVATSVTSGVPYTGATQAVDLGAYDMKVNGVTIGIGSGNLSATSNTAIGVNALLNNTSGSYNTAIGNSSLKSNTSGIWNVAIGNNALLNITTGQQNTAIGSASQGSSNGNSNTSVGFASLSNGGSFNNAFGVYALNNNIGGDNNVMGFNAMMRNTTGSNNIAIGTANLWENKSGSDNIAIGGQALYNNIGNNGSLAIGKMSQYFTDNRITGRTTGNVSIGDFSMQGASYISAPNDPPTTTNTGIKNTAIGYESMKNITSGQNNTVLGYSAGSIITNGSNNISIGYNSQPSSNSVSNEITLGNSDITTLRAAVTSITSLSDARDKKNINDLSIGLNFINSLKPRIFNWDKREWYKNGQSDGSKVNKEVTAGFIAQELDEAQTKNNAEWLKLVFKANPNKWEATYGNLLPVVVKSIQELSAEKDKEINELKERIFNLEKLVNKFLEQKK